MSDNASITIPLEEYNELCRAAAKLYVLEGAGVDNWPGYDYAMEMLGGEEL